MLIVNMSVWASIEALFDFVYRTDHSGVMRSRKTWFVKPAAPHMALWWLAAGTLPTTAEGALRLEHLRAHGPSAFAFTLKHCFGAPVMAA